MEKAEPEKKEASSERKEAVEKKETTEKKEETVVKTPAKKESGPVSKVTEKKPVSRKTVSVKKEETEPYVVEEGIDLTTVPEPKTPPKEFAETKRDAWTVDSFDSDKY